MLLIITQTIFSAEIICYFIKLCYYKFQLDKVCKEFQDIFFVLGLLNADTKILLLDATLDYECLKSYCKISISSKYFLATKHNAKKIENDKIEQIFMANHFFETGKSEMNYNNVKINIYNKERMLIELIRNKNTMPFDYYKEIISNYREIADEIDMSLLADYLDCFTNGKRIFEIIHREVF